MNNSKFIRNVLKGIMDELDTRQELSDLINFDGAKVLQVTGEILKVECTNLTHMLFTLNGTKALFRDIRNMEFEKNLIRGSNLVHKVFGGNSTTDMVKNKNVHYFKHENKHNITTMAELRCDYWSNRFKRELFII